ncbi:MAG: maltose ABC transporter permease [Chloroflexi bacterium]|nr:MAG: maltose ABC transporter permease [Chloroflexota bacterium]
MKQLSALRHHPLLLIGLIIILVLVLFGPVGRLFVDTNSARVGSALPEQRPSSEYPLGTDTVGREILAVMVVGTPLTLRIGLIAGAIGLGLGILFGFLAGYFGGWVDALIKGAADVLLTVPGLLFLVVLATTIRGAVSVNMMALVVASLAWMWPTRTIRAQVLTLRERQFVMVARLSGMGGFEIIVRELIPNLLPYLAASFVAAVGSAILATIGLEALGLGPQNEPTLGMTIYWALYYTSVLRGLWWWWMPPLMVIIATFIGLFLISLGLDQIANPKLRKAT